MKKLFAFAVLLFALPALAQTTPPPQGTTFTISAKAIGSFSGGTEVAATDAVAELGLTKNFSIRSDNIVTPDGQAFYNGVQYVLPVFSKAIAKTTLPQQFQLYVTGGVGVARNQSAQAVGGTGGGGINYDPTSSSHFSLNLIEVRWASQLPGPRKVSQGVVISSGLSLSF